MYYLLSIYVLVKMLIQIQIRYRDVCNINALLGMQYMFHYLHISTIHIQIRRRKVKVKLRGKVIQNHSKSYSFAHQTQVEQCNSVHEVPKQGSIYVRKNTFLGGKIARLKVIGVWGS